MKFWPFETKKSRAQKIQTALDEEQLDYARELLDEISHKLKSEDVARLEYQLSRLTRINEVQKAINSYDFNLARQILRNGGLSVGDTQDLEAKIQEITEEGLLNQIRQTKNQEKISLAEKYLQIYPEGENKKTVIEELLIEEFSVLLNQFENLTDFHNLCVYLKQLGSKLEKYSKEGIKLTGVVDSAKIREEAYKYLDFKTVNVSERPLKIGDKVKVAPKHHSETSFIENYVHERDAMAPLNTQGEIIGISDGRVFVRFPGVTRTFWSTNWNPTSIYWAKTGKHNVAAYDSKEVLPIEEIDQISINTFIKEQKKIADLLDDNYTRKTEPVKKRHNPEITEQDKVLPRSDYTQVDLG